MSNLYLGDDQTVSTQVVPDDTSSTVSADSNDETNPSNVPPTPPPPSSTDYFNQTTPITPVAPPPTSDYIQQSSEPDFSQKVDPSQFLDGDSLTQMRYQYQLMSIDDMNAHVSSVLQNMESTYQDQISQFNQQTNYGQEAGWQMGVIGPDSSDPGTNEPMSFKSAYQQHLIDMARDHEKAISAVTATLWSEFNNVNAANAQKANVDAWTWEQQKFQAKYQAQAEQQWQTQTQSGTLASVTDEDMAQVSTDQARADDLSSRFANLPTLKDPEFNMRRLLAFKTMIEQGYLDDCENICIIYENLSPDIQAQICNTTTENDVLIQTAKA